MKKILLFLFLSVAVKTFCNAQNNVQLLTAEEKRNYVLSIDQTEITNLHYRIPPYRNNFYNHKKYKLTTIPVKLTNSSNDTLKYFIMSCSVGDSYHTNSRYIKILESICQYNGVITKKLPPNQSSTADIPIRVIKTLNSSNNNFKVSLNICRSMGHNRFGLEMPDLSVPANYIWSNEVKLPLPK